MDSHARNNRSYLIVGVSVLAASLAACGGGSSGGGGSPNPPPPPPPPSNNAPQLNGPSDFTFDENQAVAFDIQASDADGQTVTFTLQPTGDGALFSIDSDSGRVTDIAPAGYFDFENPQDLNGDNNYELNVALSDGVATTDVIINVTINDVDGPLTCSSGDTVSVDENVTGRVYEFAASKPDTEPGQIMFEGMLSVTRQGAGVVSDDILFSLSLNPVSRVLSLFDLLNAESEGDLANAYTISTTVRIDQEIANCSVNLQVEDVVNEVTSGIKFSGSYPNAIFIRSGSIGDLDGDGLNELWLGSRKEINGSPWEHQGHVVFGQAVSDEIAQDGAEEILISALNSANSAKVAGSFPPVQSNRFIGNDLVARQVGDIDGDGQAELLLALRTPTTALESAFAGRPLAYLLWSSESLTQADGEIDLNTLAAGEGMLLEGLDGIDRRGNSVASGDFDGDGIPDIVVGIPGGEIQATATSRYRGQVFVVFGSYIRAMKPVGSIDLLDDVGSLNPSEVLLLTAEDEDDVISAPPELPLLSGSGGELLAIQDMDGDGADELIVTGANVEQNSSNVAVISSQAILGARPSTGLLEYEDIPADQITVLRSSGEALVSPVGGDADGDGSVDLLFGKPDFFADTSLAALITSDVLAAVPDGVTMDVDLPSSGAVLINHTDHASYQASASFIGDIDGDGRDDLGIAYVPTSPTNGGAPAGNATLAVVLAGALDNIAQDQTFLLDQMSPGDGIHIFDSSDKNEEFEFSAVGDVDGDNVPDLLMSSKGLGKEGFLIRGADLNDAIQSGELAFDLQPRFRNAASN
ncbi:MAG: hypothetical protein QNK16_09855 [Woeseiaceae bacterium]|nr:hypothetical protein [Woeseiaceae bacterium]MDX2608676.1 hypothetical protein [Woeseiaceae bacterium]